VKGDLEHIATKLKPFDLQNRIAFPSGAKARVTVQGIEGDLVYADEFYVTLRDKNGWKHSYRRNGSVPIKIVDPLAEHERLLKSYTDRDLHDVFAYLETLK
jgi:cytochrome c oxidase cbb3-type subunit 3